MKLKANTKLAFTASFLSTFVCCQDDIYDPVAENHEILYNRKIRLTTEADSRFLRVAEGFPALAPPQILLTNTLGETIVCERGQYAEEKLGEAICETKCLLDTSNLPEGQKPYGFWENENYSVQFDDEIDLFKYMHRCGDPRWKFSNQQMGLPCLRSTRTISTDDEQQVWTPEMHSISPTELADVGGQRVAIEGSHLIPPNIEVLSDSYIKIYLLGKDNPSLMYECVQGSFIIKSQPGRLFCDTPDNMETGKYYLRPLLYDANTKTMRWIQNINPSGGLGNCGECTVNVYHETNGPKTQQYGNRYINGVNDQFHWTEWISVDDASDGNDADSWYAVYNSGRRLEICDYPIDIQVRRKSDQVSIYDIPDAEVRKNDVFDFFQIYQSDQEKGANNTWLYTPDDFEMRFYCDASVLHMYGYYRDQRISLKEDLSDNLVGVSPPDLYATDFEPLNEGEQMHVGSCNFKYDNLDYPTTIGDADGTWYDHVRCHVSTPSSFHGPVNLRIVNDKHGRWYDDEAHEGRVLYLNDNLDKLYNIYIAPQIDSITQTMGSYYGGMELEILGNKFTYNNDEATVKVGYNDCLITERSANRILCTIQPNEEELCGSEPTEYPGQPGMTADVHGSWNSDTYKVIEEVMNNRENADGFPLRYQKNFQDTHFTMGPPKSNNQATGDGYAIVTRGWFIVPRSGYYQMVVTGDDNHYLWMNTKNPQCPMESLQDNARMGDDSDMTRIAYRNGATSDLTLHSMSEVSKTMYLEKGDWHYMRGFVQEFGGHDYLNIGMKYLGDTQVGDSTEYINQTPAVENDHFWHDERHQIRRDQTERSEKQRFTYCVPEVNVTECSTDNSYKVTIAYNDDLNMKDVELDISAGAEHMAQQIEDEIFTTQCVYDDTKFITKFSKSWETGENNWPYGNQYLVTDSCQSYCGRKHLRVGSGHHYRWVYNKDIENNAKSYDIMDDDISHMCFAYYEQIDAIMLTLKSNFGDRWENWYFGTPEFKTTDGMWDYQCVDLKEFINRHSWASSKSGVSDGNLFDKGFTRLELANVWMRADSTRQKNLHVDEFRLGFLLDPTYQPERHQGITANDGKTVGEVSVTLDEENFNFVVKMKRDRNYSVRNTQCDWTVQDARILSVSGVGLAEQSKEIYNSNTGHSMTHFIDAMNENSTSVLGMVDHFEHPSRAFTGVWTINDHEFDAQASSSTVVDWFKNTMGVTVSMSSGHDCEKSFERNIYFKDTGYNPPMFRYDTTGLIRDPQNEGEEKYSIEQTVWEGGLLTYRLSPNWIRGSSRTPQVTVTIGNSPAICNTDCSFDLRKTNNEITSLSYDQSTRQVSWSFKFSKTKSDIQSMHASDFECSNLSKSGPVFTCTLPAGICSGPHDFKVNMVGFGHAYIPDGLKTIFVPQNFDQTTITTSVSAAGGAVLTFTGPNLCTGSLQHAVVKDHNNTDFNMPVRELSQGNNGNRKRRSVSEIQIQLPEIITGDDSDNSNMDLYIDFGDSLEYDFNLCTAAQSPEITSIVNALTQDANNGNLEINGNFAATPGNSWVKLDEIDLVIDSWSNSRIVVSSNVDLSNEEYELSIYFDNDGNCAGYARFYTPGTINVNLKYTNFFPSNPSVLGGETFEIHGTGFTSNIDKISVRDYNGNTCDVLTSSPSVLTCKMPCNAKTFYSIDTSGDQGAGVPQFNPTFKSLMRGSNVEICWSLAGFELFQIMVQNLDTNVEFTSPEFSYNTCWTFNLAEEGTYMVTTNPLGSNNDIILQTMIESRAFSDIENPLTIKMNGNNVPLKLEADSNNSNNMNITDPSIGAQSPTDSCYANESSDFKYVRDINNTPVVDSFTQLSEFFTDADSISFNVQSSDFVNPNCVEIYVEDILCSPTSQNVGSIDCDLDINDVVSAEMSAFTDYTVKVYIKNQGKLAAGPGVDLRFRFVPEHSNTLPQNYGSIFGGQELTLTGRGIGASSTSMQIRCDDDINHVLDVTIDDFNTVKFTTQDTNQFVCQWPKLIYNNDVLHSNLQFNYTQSTAFTANLGSVNDFNGNELKINAENLQLSGNAVGQDLTKVHLKLKKKPTFTMSFDKIPDQHHDRKKRSLRVRRDHPAFDEDEWTFDDDLNGFIHFSKTSMTKQNANFYCQALHNEAYLLENDDTDTLERMYTSMNLLVSSNSGTYETSGFWIGASFDANTNQFYKDFDGSVFDSNRWCSNHPVSGRDGVYSNHGNSNCIATAETATATKAALCFLPITDGVDLQTDCDVSGMTDTIITCIPEIEIPLGSFVCDCVYDDFGRMTSTDIEISNLSFTILTPTTVSRNGGAIMKFNAPSGTCTLCGTVVHLTNNATGGQWWGYATHTDDQNFEIELPALEGVFDLVVLNKYGGQFENVEQVTFTEIARLDSISGNNTNLVGGESLNFTGNFPNCDAEVDLKIKKLETNALIQSTTGPQKENYLSIKNTRQIIYDNQFSATLKSTTHTDSNGDDRPILYLCKANSEAETQGYTNCRQSEYCHCLIVKFFDNEVKIQHRETTDFVIADVSSKSGLDWNNGIQVDIFWNSDSNVYFFINNLDNLPANIGDDMSTADVLVDRDAINFYYHIREVGLTGAGVWEYLKESEISTSGITFDCSTNQMTLPSLEAGQYKLAYSESTGDTLFSSEVFTYNLAYDSIEVVGSTELEISMGGGAEIKICGQGFGDNTMTHICDQECVFIENIETGDNTECFTCRAPSLSDVSSDQMCDLKLSDAHNNEEILVNNALEYKMSLTPILTGLDKKSGGSLGGSTINLTGSNFSDDINNVEVSIFGSICDVTAASQTQITCVTNAYPRDVVGYEAVPLVKITGKGYAWHDPANEEDLKFEYVDLWSSTYTWGCTDGTCFPQEGEIIVIPTGYRVVLDVDTPVLKALLIDGGELIVRSDQTVVKLQSEYIVINNNGALHVGTEEEGYDCSKEVEIILYGHHRSIKLPLFGAKVLAVRSGTLDLHGCRREHTWTVLDQPANAGDTQLITRATTGWSVGDRVLIATTGGRKSQKESEQHIISAINGKTITLATALEYDHVAADTFFEAADGEVRKFEQRAEVAVMNRNVKVRGSYHSEWQEVIPECEAGPAVGLNEVQTCFQGQFGEEVASDQFGATIMMHKITHGKIEFCEIFHSGQAFALGRYSMHFHLSGDQPNSYIRGNSIHDTFNRALTMHGVNQALVEHNVAFNVMGLTFFIEDAIEENNIIQYNLAVFTRPSSSLLNVDQTPTSFWIVNPNNIVRHNHAAGGSSFGYWMNPPAHPTGPSFTEDYCPRQQVIGEFHNNTAHSFGVYGFWIFEEYSASIDGSCFEDLPGGSSNPANWGQHVMTEFYSWGCERGVEMTLGGGHSLHRFIAANNELSQIAVMETTGPKHEFPQAMKVTDSIMAGYTNAWPKGSVLDSGSKSMGLQTPWKSSTFYADGLAFYNFDNGGVGVDPCYSSYPFDCVNTQWFWRTKWGDNVPKKIKFDWEHELQLVDMDGTFTENEVIGAANPKSYIVIRDTDIVDKSKCYDEPAASRPGQPGIVCEDTYLLRTGFNQPDPDSLSGFPARVTTEHGISNIPFRFKRSTHGFGWCGFLLSQTHNKLDFEALRVNHTFNNGEIRFFKEDTWLTLETPFLEEIDRMQFGSDVNTNNNRNISYIPTKHDEAFSYKLENRTGIFHMIGGDHSHLDKEKLPFKYRAFVPQELWNQGEDITGETCVWSDASCWESGEVPGPNDDVFITKNNEVIVDIPNAQAQYVYLGQNAKIVFNATGDITFKAKGIQIGVPLEDTSDLVSRKRRGLPALIKTRSRRSTSSSSGAAIEIGTEDAPFDCSRKMELILDGSYSESRGTYDGSVPIGAKALAVFSGLKMYGCPIDIPSTQLKVNANAGDSFIQVNDDVADSWQVGGSVGISSSGNNPQEAERRTITSINRDSNGITRVGLDTPLAFEHLGVDDSFTSFGSRSIDQGAEVVYLTRNIKITARNQETDADWNYGIGGRIVVASRDALGDEEEDQYGWAQFSNVEFEGMGQFGYKSIMDPRYAIAFWKTAGQTGNPSRPVAENSFVRNCAFHDGYWTQMGAFFTDNIEFSNNVIYNSVDSGMRLYQSENAVIEGNTHLYLKQKQLYIIDKGFSMNNSDFDGENIPFGIQLEAIKSVTLRNNRMASIEAGCGYKILGEECQTSEVCSTQSVTSPNSNNIVHSAAFGVWILKDTVTPCAKISGFNIFNIQHVGVYSQAEHDFVIVDNVFIFDTKMALLNILFKPDSISHVIREKKFTLKSSTIGGHSPYLRCSEYENWNNIDRYSLFTTSIPTLPSGNSWVGINEPGFQIKYNKFPKKSLDKIPDYPAIYGESCVLNTEIDNFNNLCTTTPFFAVAGNRKQVDSSGPVRFISGNTFTNNDNKLVLLHPKLAEIHPSSCVDMSCDKHRRSLYVDEDGSLTGTPASYITSHTDYQWDGDLPWGLGDYRIPKTMVTRLDGSRIPYEDYAPHKGAHREDNCSFDAIKNAYVCLGNKVRYTYLIMESLDADNLVRRMSPIALKSSAGYIDLVNGPSDHSCCSGYACQIRISMFKALVACGETYEIHTTGTIAKNMLFRMPYEYEQNCKINIKLYIGRQNRQDLYLDGSIVHPSDAIVDSNGEVADWNIPNDAYKPSINGDAGENYFSRFEESLYFNMETGNEIEIRNAKSILLQIGMEMQDLTTDEFYENGNLAINIAALLGVDPSKIRVVNVIREDSRRKRRSANQDFIVIEISDPAPTEVEGREEEEPASSGIVTVVEEEEDDSDVVDNTLNTTAAPETTAATTTVTAEVIDESSVSSNYETIAKALSDDPTVLTGAVANSFDEISVEDVAPPAIAVVVEAKAPEWLAEDSDGSSVNIYAVAGVADQDDDALVEAGFIVEELETYEETQAEILEQQSAAEKFITYNIPDYMVLDPTLPAWNSHQFVAPSKLDSIVIRMYDTEGNLMDSSIGPVLDPYTVEVYIEGQEAAIQGTTTVAFDVYGRAIFDDLSLTDAGIFTLHFRIVETQEMIDNELSFAELPVPFELYPSFVPSFIFEDYPDSDPSPEPEDPSSNPEGEPEGEPESNPEDIMSQYPPEHSFCLTNFEGRHPNSLYMYNFFTQWENNCEGLYYSSCEDISTVHRGLEARCGKFQTCINNQCECSLDAGAAVVPYTESRDGFSIADHISVQCWSNQMKVQISKCALNIKGFKLNNIYLGGEANTFQEYASTSCHGQMKFTDSGTVYEYNLDADNTCGSTIHFDENANTYSFYNLLQAYPNGMENDSETGDLEMLSVKLACNNVLAAADENEVPFSSFSEGEILVNQEGSRQEPTPEGEQSVSLPNMPKVEYFHPVFVNKAPNAENLYVVDMFGFINEHATMSDYLVWDTTLTLDANDNHKVVIADTCWLSTSPDASAAHFYDILIDGCPGDHTSVVENGISKNVKFNIYTAGLVQASGMSFTYSSPLFVHCELDICDPNQQNCVNNCN